MLLGTDAAYIAGLIDGEGTVTLTRKHRNENRQLCVSISAPASPFTPLATPTLYTIGKPWICCGKCCRG